MTRIKQWLYRLDIPEECHRMTALLPLVYIAWADGSVQRSERAVILAVAEEQGWVANGGRAVLERWLSEPPTPAQLETSLALLKELGRGSDKSTRGYDADELQLLLAWCQDVADAAGGMLGLRPPRQDGELAALRTIAASLEIERATNWRAVFSE